MRAFLIALLLSGATFADGTSGGSGGGGGGGSPSGNASGDLGGTYPSPTVLSVANVTTGPLIAGAGGTGGTQGAIPSPLFRRHGFWQPTVIGASTAVAVGMQTPTNIGAAAANSLAFSGGVWPGIVAVIPVSAVGTNPAGFAGPFTETCPSCKPKITFVGSGLQPSACVNDRVWIGITSADIKAIAVRTAASGAGAIGSAIAGVAFGCDAAVSSDVMMCTFDKTNYSCIDSTVAIASFSNPASAYIVDWQNSSSPSFTIYTTSSASVTLTKSSNIPTIDGTPMGIQMTSVGLAGGVNGTIYPTLIEIEQTAGW